MAGVGFNLTTRQVQSSDRPRVWHTAAVIGRSRQSALRDLPLRGWFGPNRIEPARAALRSRPLAFWHSGRHGARRRSIGSTSHLLRAGRGGRRHADGAPWLGLVLGESPSDSGCSAGGDTRGAGGHCTSGPLRRASLDRAPPGFLLGSRRVAHRYRYRAQPGGPCRASRHFASTPANDVAMPAGTHGSVKARHSRLRLRPGLPVRGVRRGLERPATWGAGLPCCRRRR